MQTKWNVRCILMYALENAVEKVSKDFQGYSYINNVCEL